MVLHQRLAVSYLTLVKFAKFHFFTSFFTEFRVAASGMAWKGVDSEGVTAMASADIKWVQWMRVARDFQLRVGLRDHRKEKFDGFMREARWVYSLF